MRLDNGVSPLRRDVVYDRLETGQVGLVERAGKTTAGRHHTLQEERNAEAVHALANEVLRREVSFSCASWQEKKDD
jgi:hypothetical protein